MASLAALEAIETDEENPSKLENCTFYNTNGTGYEHMPMFEIMVNKHPPLNLLNIIFWKENPILVLAYLEAGGILNINEAPTHGIKARCQYRGMDLNAESYYRLKVGETKKDIGVVERGETKAEYRCATNLSIPYGVARIGGNQYEYKTISSIGISNTMKAIDSAVFYSSSSSSITFNDGVRTINIRAFLILTLIPTTIPGSMDIIGTYAFKNATDLKEATIEKGVERLGNDIFKNSTLSKLAIYSSSILGIDERMFNDYIVNILIV